jgi:hypothetical protein
MNKLISSTLWRNDFLVFSSPAATTWGQVGNKVNDIPNIIWGFLITQLGHDVKHVLWFGAFIG